MATTEGDHFNPPDTLHRLLPGKEDRFSTHYNDLQARNMTIRPLNMGDYQKSYAKLLIQSTNMKELPQARFTEQFQAMKTSNSYYVVVVEDQVSKKIVATGTLSLERTFLHTGSLRGRIMDLFIDREEEIQDYRYSEGNLAKVLLDILTVLAKKVGCYKVTVESEDHFLQFFQSFGYAGEKRGHLLTLRFPEQI